LTTRVFSKIPGVHCSRTLKIWSTISLRYSVTPGFIDGTVRAAKDEFCGLAIHGKRPTYYAADDYRYYFAMSVANLAEVDSYYKAAAQFFAKNGADFKPLLDKFSDLAE